MTHGYEYFEFDYFDIDMSSFFEDFYTEYEETISEMWGEIEETYEDLIGNTEDFDIYEQDEEDEIF